MDEDLLVLLSTTVSPFSIARIRRGTGSLWPTLGSDAG